MEFSILEVTLVRGVRKMTNKQITFDSHAIESIANGAVLEVEGVLATQGNAFDRLKANHQEVPSDVEGVNAEVGTVEVAIDLDIVVEYGQSIPSIHQEVVKQVSEKVALATQLDVVEVNIHIVDILTMDEFQKVQLKQINV